MHFDTKSYLKSTYNHTAKHTLKVKAQVVLYDDLQQAS